VKNYLVQCGAMRSPDEARMRERSSELNKAFERVEVALGNGPYFWGEQLRQVDLAWLPLLHRAAIIERHTGYDFLRHYPQIKNWQQALLATGLAEQSVAPDFEQVFTAFYLSGSTFLGTGQNCQVDSASQCGGEQCCV